METFELVWSLNDERIVAAIRQAESRTSSEFRVYVSDREASDPMAAAQEIFLRLGMASTRDRNAVLIFVAPKSQTFAIVGDIGVHSRCGESFWSELAEQVQRRFSTDQYTDAIVGAIARAADLLAGHFPPCTDDCNELSDAVVRP